jgi:tetratricopeptide (TPR) repeat protein
MDWPALAGGAVLAALAVAAYGRTFSIPLIFDDESSIANNTTIRHLGTAFLPPVDSTVSGRPAANLSLAANYAVSGTAVGSYHAVNLAIHILAGLTLFGIVRRTLAPRTGASAFAVAFSASLLWTLHPLQTESVTYIVQRAESLMGLFYLLTLYCFIRGAGAGGPGRFWWLAASVFACLLGMGTKEVMVSAPLVVLLYDRTFLAGGFREAFRRRWRLYAGLAATWIALALLVLSTHSRSGTAGFGTTVAWWRYALTQLPAVVHYLWLCFWPHRLIFDYGSALEIPSFRVVPCALIIAGLAAATAWALARRPAVGFLGASFFAILAPSSSIVPVATETIAEHRMYLPLAAVAVLVVLGIHRWLGRGTLPLCLALVAVLSWATWERNEDYRSNEAIWSDTVAKLPENERAQYNLGCFLQKTPGRLDEAVAHFQEALRLRPDYADADCNLGASLASLGRMPEAIARYKEALRLKPGLAEAHNDLGNALSSTDRTQEAIPHYEEALRLRPDYAEAHNDLGNALSSTGRALEAIPHYEEALRLRPDLYQANYNLGNALNALGRTPEAIAQYEQALRIRPDDATIHFYLAGALLRIPGRTGEAVAQLREVLRLEPDNDRARRILARIEPFPQ